MVPLVNLRAPAVQPPRELLTLAGAGVGAGEDTTIKLVSPAIIELPAPVADLLRHDLAAHDHP